MAIHNNIIPLIPTLNLMFPYFGMLPAPPGSHLLEMFTIVPLWLDLDEANIAAEYLYYYYDCIALPLCSEKKPYCLQVPMGEGIQMEGIELHTDRRSECMCGSSLSPYLLESPLLPQQKLKKKTQKTWRGSLAALSWGAITITTEGAASTAALPYCKADDIPQVKLLVLLQGMQRPRKAIGDSFTKIEFSVCFSALETAIEGLDFASILVYWVRLGVRLEY